LKGRDFILLIQKEFNDGKPLPYRYKMFVKPWKQAQTKDWVNYDENKYWTPTQYLSIIKDIKEYQEIYLGKNKRRKKTL
jgi:hypothetical protein